MLNVILDIYSAIAVIAVILWSIREWRQSKSYKCPEE